MKPLRILIIDDSQEDTLLIARALREGGYSPDMYRVSTQRDIRKALRRADWHLIISDYNLKDVAIAEIMAMINASNLEIPLLVVSANSGADQAVAVMKMGAHDYISKHRLARLVPAIERELREVETRRAHKRAQQVIQHLSHFDGLTGLANRHAFEDRLAALLHQTQHNGEHHVLLYIDLDQFKIINDTSGHIAGDELLKQLTRVLMAPIRQTDTLARLGGDEFGVLLSQCQVKQGLKIANELLSIIMNFRYEWEEQTFSVGASIGLVDFSGDMYKSAALVMSAADMACYAAKDMGRNRVHVYSDNDAHLLRRQGEMQWVSRINKAIDSDSFTLYQQKIIHVAQQTPVWHIEFLLRMLDENGEIILPGAFIPAAENYNLMHHIDRLVVKKVFEYLAKNETYICAEQLAFINLSGASLSDDNFFRFIREQISHHRLNPANICFEITETAAISNLNKAVSFITEIRTEGFKFALDDFGVGLSSFSYLKTIPVDFIKIDGSFIQGMLHDPLNATIVESINRIGQVSGLKTIAEFVENEAILLRLRELQLDFAQGYAIHTPEPGYTSSNLISRVAD